MLAPDVVAACNRGAAGRAALAESPKCALVTADARLSQAPGATCTITVPS